MITKSDLTMLLKSLEIPFSEGIQLDKDATKFPRIVLMEMMWDEVNASGTSNDTVVRYQISFFAKRPRDPKILELRRLLLDKGLSTQILHEFITEPSNQFHSFMAVDVIENLNE